MNVALWIIQVLLAALFVFAGGAKLVMSIEQMQQGGIPLPGPFLRFIGLAEVAKAVFWSFFGVRKNVDRRMRGTADRVLEGRLKWLEEGIVER